MLSTILRQGLSKLQLEIDDSQQQQLLNYVQLLYKWNKAYNLTGKCTQEQLLTRHILDCLSIARYLDIDNLDTDNILDIGTGAGLPGIPLAIAFQIKNSLIDL